jgi:rubrerythrin
MQLGTFGAIMTFSMELENKAGAFYESDAELPGELREDLKKRSMKRHRRLEKARRECVVELALEAISGLDGDDYAFGEEGKTGLASGLAGAITVEETLVRFYREAGAKMPILEIVRRFERCAKENDANLERLQNALKRTE